MFICKDYLDDQMCKNDQRLLELIFCSDPKHEKNPTGYIQGECGLSKRIGVMTVSGLVYK